MKQSCVLLSLAFVIAAASASETIRTSTPSLGQSTSILETPSISTSLAETEALTTPAPDDERPPLPKCQGRLACPRWRVNEVFVQSTDEQAKVAFVYKDYTTFREWGDQFHGGTSHGFSLGHTEVIVRIEQLVGPQCTHGLKFFTSHGQETPWFGISEGTAIAPLVASEENPIVGIEVQQAEDRNCHSGMVPIVNIIRLSEASVDDCPCSPPPGEEAVPTQISIPTPTCEGANTCPQFKLAEMYTEASESSMEKITFVYSHGTVRQWGSNGGHTHDSFSLFPDEVVVTIDQKIGFCSFGFRLITSKGRESQWFGSTDGVAAPPLKASAANPIVAIELGTRDALCSSGMAPMVNIVRLSEAAADSCPCAAPAGEETPPARIALPAPECDHTLNPSPTCKSSTVSELYAKTDEWGLHQLTFVYTPDPHTAHESWGPSTGQWHDVDFWLDAGEVITRVQHRTGLCTFAMKFYSNRGRESSWIGNANEGEVQEFVASEGNPIVGFQVQEHSYCHTGLPPLTGIVRLSDRAPDCVSCAAALELQQTRRRAVAGRR